VADRHFEDFVSGLNDTGGNLRLDLETAALHRQGTSQGTRHHLVACFHVVNVASVQHVGDGGEEMVAPTGGEFLWGEITTSIDRDFAIASLHSLLPFEYQRGRSCGLYSMSASCTVTIYPLTSPKPVRRPAPLPWLRSWRT